MRDLLRVLRYVRPYRGAAAASIAITVVIAALALLAPWPLKILFDSVLGSHPLPGPVEPVLGPFADRKMLLLLVVVAGGFAITLAENGLAVLNSYLQTRLEQGMILDFRSDLFQHAQRLHMAFHDRRRSGSLIYAINFQADAAAGLVMAIQPLAQSALTLVGMFWLTMQINVQLALLSLVVIPFLYWAVGWYIHHIQDRLREVQGMEAESLSIVHEAVSMIRVIVTFGRESHEFRRFREQGRQAVDARVGVTVRQTLFSLVVNTTTAAGTALILGFGVYQIVEGRMTGGELLVVLTYIASIYSPLEAISNTVGGLQDRFIALEMAFGLLDTERDIRDRPGAVVVRRARGSVAFEDVDFSYESRQHTLAGVSFRAEPGEVVGIVGPTGAGKSTLVNLIPRLYDPDGGRILMDGRDLRDISLESLRAQISVVLQEPLLFSGTIAENIRYARLDATDDEIEEAARAANAHDFISRLPQGYETRLGERGAQMSGGERQRISVARAFLRDAPILILDEPTSAIDSRTESVILDALDRLVEGRTTFMIAHRLSTLRKAGQILVIDGGRVVQRGTHDELLAADGLYHGLWTMQMGGAPPPHAAAAAAGDGNGGVAVGGAP